MKENRARVNIKILIAMLVAIAAWVSYAPYATAEVKTVPSGDICMVANRIPGYPTIKVPIDGRTYYVCCRNCEARIRQNPALRYAKDPLTRKKINKAEAFIALKDDGSVAYFESRESAERYFAGMKKAL